MAATEDEVEVKVEEGVEDAEDGLAPVEAPVEEELLPPNPPTIAYLDDEDDPVVAEYDVYVSQNLADQLVVLQYPLKGSKSEKYVAERQKNVRIKPVSKKLEFDYELEDNINFDSRSPYAFPHITLQSEQVPLGSNYAIGVLREGQVHFTPIKSMMQMRPSLRHIDEEIEMMKKRDEPVAVEDDKSSSKRVKVQYKKRESKEQIERRTSSYVFLKEQEDAEPWQHLQLVAQQDDLTEQFEDLFVLEDSIDVDNAHFFNNISAADYLEALRPKEGQVVDNDDEDEGLSVSMLMKMAFLDQVPTLMQHVRIMSLTRMENLLKHPAHDFIAPLEQCAHLVRGVWICKRLEGASEELQSGWDTLLALFFAAEFVKRQDFGRITKLKAGDTKELLRMLCTPVPGKGWALRIQPDEDFITAFPEVVRRHEEVWQARCDDALNPEGEEDDNSRYTALWKLPTVGRQLLGFLQDIFSARGVCSLDYITQELLLRQLDTHSNNLLAGGVTEDELAQQLKQHCLAVRDNVYALATIGDEDVDKFRHLIIKALIKSKDGLTKRELKSAAKTVPDDVLTRIIKEIAVEVRKKGKSDKGKKKKFALKKGDASDMR